jgi:hypothetical protein
MVERAEFLPCYRIPNLDLATLFGTEVVATRRSKAHSIWTVHNTPYTAVMAAQYIHSDPGSNIPYNNFSRICSRILPRLIMPDCSSEIPTVRAERHIENA